MPWTRNSTSSSLAASSSNTRMNSAPMILRLRSGSLDALELGQEPVLGVDGHQRHLELIAEGLDHLRALVLAHEAVIDEHAGQPVPDRPVHEQRGHRGVDAARQAADGPAVPHLGADARDLVLDHRGGAPALVTAADVGEEVGQHLLAVGGVHDLGVKLDPVDAALGGLEGGHRRRGRGGQRREAGRRREDGVAVRHPARLLRGRAGQQPARVGHSELRAPELAHLGALDTAAQLQRDELHAVADAEHRHPELEQRRLERRRAVGVHRGRAAGQDHALGPATGHLGGADVVGQQFGEHAALAHAARDQLRVLPAVVEHHHLVGGGAHVLQPVIGRGPADLRRLLESLESRSGRRAGVNPRLPPPRPGCRRPCPRPARAGGACPPSAARERPSARRG